MRRMLWTLAIVATVGTVAAGCGGSDKKADSTAVAGTTSESSSSGTDVSQVLSGVKTAALGPSKIHLDATLKVDGAPSGQGATLLAQPIHIVLDGTTSGADVDSTLTLTIKDKPVEIGLLSSGGKSFVKIDGKWFDSGAVSSAGSSLSPSVGKLDPSSLDAGKITASLGDLSKLFKPGATLSDDEVEGIKTDHVSGLLDAQGVTSAVASIAKATGQTITSPTATDVTKLDKVLKDAKVDIWVGKDDHLVHRLAVVGTITPEQATSGVTAVGVKVDVTSTPASDVKIAAPGDVRPAAELQAAALNLLTPFIGDLQATS